MKVSATTILLVLLMMTVARAQSDSLVVRGLTIDGLKRTRPWVVRRDLGFAVGDTLDPERLEQADKRLRNLMVFNDVSTTSDSAGQVKVAVTEAWPYIPIVSMAFTEGRLADVRGVESFLDRAAIQLGGLDLNFRGDASRLWAMAEFGATSGMTGGYFTRWLSPRLPISVEVMFQSLTVSDRHSAVLDSSRALRDNRVGLSVATRQGARARIGIDTRYQHVSQDDNWPAQGRTDATFWASPFVVIDRRDLEWYPSRGSYSRVQTNLVMGSVSFVRSTAELRGYWAVPAAWPIVDALRPPVLAVRAAGGTCSGDAPSWAHFYDGFNRGFRAYRSVKTESANYLSAEAEFRVPLTHERSFSMRRFGRYGSRLPFGVSALVAAERHELQLDGTRFEGSAAALGLLVRVPYIQIVEAGWEINGDGETSLSLDAGIRF
jgi:outer membrane protein assembly factor BamA